MSTEIYEAYHLDADEGRSSIHVGFFDNHTSARQAAEYAVKDLGNSPAGPGAVRTIKVFRDFAEWSQGERDKLIRSARAKLNPQERAALGI